TAGLAARRSTPDEVAHVRREAGELAAATHPGDRRRADARLRVLVTVAAQSPRLYRAEVGLQAEIGTLLWLTLGDDDVHRDEVGRVTELVDALDRRDPAAARDAAEGRVRAANAHLLDLRISLEDG
ncbi:MAG: FCD domain-containing protein, partial [Marmoricola sp.]|nr:FCD domain-containing protein [Marmoricola sp.]